MHNASEHALAVLVDIENMARPGARNRGEFDIHLVMNRLAEKGRVVVKRAYADWSRYRDARQELMNAGLELIEMPSAREGAKNRADIKMAVDAMEIAYSRQHVDNFVIVSGDSDFTPLVGKLRELNKRVIGVGRDASSASPLLIANCDEFFFYDSLASKALPHQHTSGGGVRPDALSLLRETLMARQREGDEHPQASAVKDSMRRRDPAFDEGEIGFSTFSKFLEDAQSKGVVRLQRDSRSGTFAVELADAAPASDWPSVSEERPVELRESRPPRRRRRRGGESADTAGGNGPRTESETVAEPDSATDAEVFEFEVPVRPREKAALPPLDQPITYEDVLAADDLDEELPDLVEASDAVEDVPTRGSRRRRRSLSTVAEPTSDDLAADEEADEAAAAAAEDASGAAPADEATPPAGRRRVRRGTVLGTITEPEAPVADVPAEDAGDEAPAPKRRTRAKKTDDAVAEPAVETPAAEAPATDDEAPAPKRRTRAKKPAEDAVTAPVVETPAAADEDESAKPKRRPRAKKADAPDAPPVAEATVPDDDTATASKRRVRRRPTTADGSPAAADDSVNPKVSPY